ncbi:MAG: hypothetical protein U1F57_04925 [bacterium]
MMLKQLSFLKRTFFVFLLIPFFPLSAKAASPISVVEVTGKEVPSFLQKEIKKMSVRVFRQGAWQAIPFQIDEKAFDGISQSRRWVLDEAFSRRTDLPVGDGKLDDDEVILFMTKDLGEKASPEHSPDHPVLELKTASGYAYLFYDPKASPTSPEKYVRYDPQEDQVDALGYKNGFNKDHAIVQEELIPKNQKTGTGTNILDRFKVRMLLAIKHLFDVHVEEDNITSKRIGYRAGPIRIIRRVSAYKALGPFRLTPKAESDFMFYPYFVQVPSRLDNPLDGRKSLNPDSKGFAGFDFTHFFYGSKFYSDKNPRPVIIDGNMSPEEKALATKDVTWWAVTGDKGSMIVKVNWDPNLLKQGVTCNLYYMDDRNSLKAPEMDPGEAAVGFQLDFTEIPAGHYAIYVNQIFPPASFEIGGEKGLLGQIHSPSVTVTPLE